ncbi:MAG: LamG domain-containing protein [Gammaproteobacteria bacterium]|nr:LamG domain-containing protein [Gammaproteobacteria bacterium]
MTREVEFPIGPPNSQYLGMMTTYKRQQIPSSAHWMLRNVRLSGEALERRKGIVRLVAGAREAVSLSSDGTAATYIEIPVDDGGVDTGEFVLGTRWTIFASYRPDDLADDILVLSSQESSVAPGYLMRHEPDGTVTGKIRDTSGTDITLSSTTKFTSATRVDVQLVRDRGAGYLYVNGTLEDSDTTTLSATLDTKPPVSNLYMGSNAIRPTGSEVTFYELRIHREAITSDEWRATQYPWGGRYGDPNVALYCTFEDGAGTTVEDWSRNNHATIALVGAGWAWNSSTERQVVTPVTGIHIMEVARGRRWLIADIGINHYRIPLN